MYRRMVRLGTGHKLSLSLTAPPLTDTDTSHTTTQTDRELGEAFDLGEARTR